MKKNQKHSAEAKTKISLARKENEQKKKEALILSQSFSEKENKRNKKIVVKLSDAASRTFSNLTPERIVSILKSTDSGELKTWDEWVDEMLANDFNLRSLVGSRINAVAYSDFIIEPADQSDEAQAAADHIRRLFGKLSDLKQLFSHLLRAPHSGLEIGDIQWVQLSNGLMDIKTISPVPIRFFRYNQQNQLCLIQCGNEPIDNFGPRFLVHAPKTPTIFPHKNGTLKAASWLYFFSRAGLSHWLAGSQKFAYNQIKATVPDDTDAEQIQSTWQTLNDMLASGVIVSEESTSVDNLNSNSANGSLTWNDFLTYLDKKMAILILAGTLTVDAGDRHSYEIGKVHERIRNGILSADGEALAETLLTQIIVPYFQLNLQFFGGKLPPLPKIWFDIKAYNQIEEWQVDLGLITNNELRESLVLPRLKTEQGGNDFILPFEKILQIVDRVASNTLSKEAGKLLIKQICFSFSDEQIETLFPVIVSNPG